jgi:hypothetical protein
MMPPLISQLLALTYGSHKLANMLISEQATVLNMWLPYQHMHLLQLETAIVTNLDCYHSICCLIL